MLKCNLCKYKTKHAGDLKRHKAHVHNIGVVWHPCDKCDHKCKQASALKKHKADVHDIDVVWHPCDKCDFKSKQAGDLKKHKATHNSNVHITGKIAGYECGICSSFSCSTEVVLLSHMSQCSPSGKAKAS